MLEPIGEVWLTSVECYIASGVFAGKTLGAAWAEMTSEWRGEQLATTPEFPLLIKFLFPDDKLSIQVHPGDAYAFEHEKNAGGHGKTEMWHAISAFVGARVLLGLKPGVDKEKFLEALKQNKLENLFEAVSIKTSDTLFVPAGTPHSIGPKMVLCEIQQYSDITYRVYDYNRVDAHGTPRELHIKKALDVTRFGEPAGGRVTPLSLPADGAARSLLAACRYFATERWECSTKCTIPVDSARFELIVILDGAGSIAWPDSAARYHRGECWLVPASQGCIDLMPEVPTTFIRTFVPDLAGLEAELHREGISAGALAQVIFDSGNS